MVASTADAGRNVTARKIRETLAGLVAMPADRDETTVTADDLASDPTLCTAWTELQSLMPDEPDAAWVAAIDAASDNDMRGLRWHLERARAAAMMRQVDVILALGEAGRPLSDALADSGTAAEDATLAMLPAQTTKNAARG